MQLDLQNLILLLLPTLELKIKMHKYSLKKNLHYIVNNFATILYKGGTKMFHVRKL